MMKKQPGKKRSALEVSILTIVISIILIGMSCKTENKDINKGLVAYFPFSGNAKNVKNAFKQVKAQGAALTTDRFGKEDRAYAFNGINSEISSEVTKMPGIEEPKTISWWYYSESMPLYKIDPDLGAENMIVLVDSTAGMGIQFGFRAPGYKTRGFDCWEWGGGTFFEIPYPEFQKWHHCVYSYDGQTHVFYLDGEKVMTSTVSPKAGKPKQLMFGNYPGGDQFFKGKLDEVRIYGRVLNETEVKTLLNEKE